MFDVGFSELVMVAIVALVVLGPERLPKAARVAGMWVGRARRTLASVKQEIDRELKAGELAETLRQQTISNPLERILEETPSTTASPPSKPHTSAASQQPEPATLDRNPHSADR
jgi:sec-independent protein translocase protein TatB